MKKLQRSTWSRTLLRLIAALFSLAFIAYSALLANNNWPAAAVDKVSVNRAYERGVQWLLTHREEISGDRNPMLWWMVGQSAANTHDVRLIELYSAFTQQQDALFPDSPWNVFFFPGRNISALLPASVDIWEPYQQFMLYGASCTAILANNPTILAQENPAFCSRGGQLIRPACVTHQLMGMRFMQRNHCSLDDIDKKIFSLQDKLVRQLTFDPRAVDVYLQRVVMLYDSGAGHRVKSRWVKRALSAQLSDGGWGAHSTIFPLGGERVLAFSARGVAITKLQSDFHATAQGVWLTSLLKAP
jgi:hypothetical protein